MMIRFRCSPSYSCDGGYPPEVSCQTMQNSDHATIVLEYYQGLNTSRRVWDCYTRSLGPEEY